MNIGPVDYASDTTPDGYRCGTCGARDCKLWREYQTFLNHQTLSCCDCAGKSQKKDVSTIDEGGRIETVYHRSRRQRRCAARHGHRGRRGARSVKRELCRDRCDQIGWRVPAVPTAEGDTFWGYSSVPDEGVAWWRRLPTRSPAAPNCPDGGDPESWSLYVFDVGPIAASAPHVAFDIEVGEEP